MQHAAMKWVMVFGLTSPSWASIPGRAAGYPNGSPTDADERN